MATNEREPIRISRVDYGSERLSLNASHPRAIQFYDRRNIDTPVEEVVVSGCNEVVVQGRMKGDFYAEASGPGICVSAVAGDIATALRLALAKAETR